MVAEKLLQQGVERCLQLYKIWQSGSFRLPTIRFQGPRALIRLPSGMKLNRERKFNANKLVNIISKQPEKKIMIANTNYKVMLIRWVQIYQNDSQIDY